ncbi:uncharacterized protein LOC123259719 [Cotesia glomerata]|uniref:Uncharacterized protein n=1 Tax=Cotesia glomerata TaxID=32391 RepID=A0AAV7HZS2_COTGL|nr:uncharacterized protein LOC123259719 [Cotesia glomerata]KAH0539800.1 hypothetical protein KQX54_008146 [Cotesia glomerata]
MENLYPNLHEKFKNEGVCPICMMEINSSSKYSCTNGHIVCHRCKPYYYCCPTCRSELNIDASSQEFTHEFYMPPAMHYMPHPYPAYSSNPRPSAPFIDNERHHWSPPPPTEDQELLPCQYSYLGCYANIPEHLRDLHESRCQFRPYLEEEHLPTDLNTDEGELESCRYSVVGCNVRLPEWRKQVHENLCIYKDRLDALDDIQRDLDSFHFEDGDPEEMVECKFNRYGCMVKMPRRRKNMHQMKCNYQKYHNENDDEDFSECSISCAEPEVDPDSHVPCRWAVYGCQVEPRYCRKLTHEEKCNYRREKCRFAEHGCVEMVEPCKRPLHESSCSYA